MPCFSYMQVYDGNERRTVMEKQSFHSASLISENTWRISEAGMVSCYLAIGTKKALLIDTGCGLGNLKAAVSEITSLPVEVVLTHMHPDHAGGIYHFTDYSVSKDDFDLTYSIFSLPIFSRVMIQGAKIKNPEMPPLFSHSNRHPIENGQIFDLGDRVIQAMAVPGHTKGSMAFIDSFQKLIFTGDDCNPSLWMHLPGCTGLKTWQVGARQILNMLKLGYTGWDGHSNEAQTASQVQRIWDLAEELMAGANNHTLDPKLSCIPSEDVLPQIRYSYKKILK